jgi:hypothetical protein
MTMILSEASRASVFSINRKNCVLPPSVIAVKNVTVIGMDEFYRAGFAEKCFPGQPAIKKTGNASDCSGFCRMRVNDIGFSRLNSR